MRNPRVVVLAVDIGPIAQKFALKSRVNFVLAQRNVQHLAKGHSFTRLAPMITGEEA